MNRAITLHRTVCLRLSRLTHSVTPRRDRARHNKPCPPRCRTVIADRIRARRAVGGTDGATEVSIEHVGTEPGRKQGTETGPRLVLPMGTEYLCECSPQSSHRQIRTRHPLVSFTAWLSFRGRPSGRTVCSRPGCLTVCRTQSSPPYGRPLSMLTRTRLSSFAVNGALTRAVQFAGRSPDNKVPMVRHNTVRQDADGLPLARLRPRFPYQIGDSAPITNRVPVFAQRSEHWPSRPLLSEAGRRRDRRPGKRNRKTRQ